MARIVRNANILSAFSTFHHAPCYVPLYLGAYEIYTETTGNTINKQRDTVHVSDDQNRIALSELEKVLTNPILITNKVIRFQLNNHLGSSSLELDILGDMISYEEYHRYGGSAYIAGRNQTETSLKRYRYSGRKGMMRLGCIVTEPGIMCLR